MKTRKIFAAAMAGLCAVSAMSVSALAANEEKVETSGAKSYKISAGFQAPTIDVMVPETFEGVINPYRIAVTLDTGVAVDEGIASPRYPITNNSAEVGINIKATYSAEGLDDVVTDPDDVVANNADKLKKAYVTLNAVATQGADDPAETMLVMDKTENATPDQLLKLGAKGGTDSNVGEIWIGGDVIEEPAEKWAASDRLSINVVLDINPFNTGATGGNTPGGFTASVAAGDIDVSSDTAYTLGALTANDTYALTIDLDTAGNLIPTFTGYTINNVSNDSGDAVIKTQTTGGVAIKYAIQPQNKGTCNVTYTLSPDDGSADVTVTFAVTVTGA